MNPPKTIWIVGGSSGIGLELVKIFLQNDYDVIASSRNVIASNQLLELKQDYENSLELINIDVKDNTSVKTAINDVFSLNKKIDVFFYNAGTYEIMNMKEWDFEKFEKMNDINYLGIVRLITNLIKSIDKDNFPKHWVWNSSLSSCFGLPLGGGYSAPKAAMVNLAESIEPELNENGIKLQVINHGFVKTRLTQKNTFDMPQLMDTDYAAKKIFEKINKNGSFEISFPFFLSSFLKLLKLLPYSISLYLTRRMLR